MAENSSRVTAYNPIRRAPRIMIVACLVGLVVVAALGLWYLNLVTPDSETVPSLVLQRTDSQLTFTVSSTLRSDVPWDDVRIRLEAAPTDSGASYTYAYWEWQPSTKLLTSQFGESIAQSMNSSQGAPAHQIVGNLTDIAGNGFVNDGDTFTLIPADNEVALTGVPCQIMFIYIPSLGEMGSLEFTP